MGPVWSAVGVRCRTTGATTAKPNGGDQRSHRIEACGTTIVAAIEAQVDLTLVELAELLKRQHGVSFAPSTVWRFLDRHGITFNRLRKFSFPDCVGTIQ